MVFLAVQVAVMCLCVVGAYDMDLRCSNISGVWVNSLGSRLSLSVDGLRLSGSYKTGVESSTGSAGKAMTGKVVGVLGSGVHPTFAMSVSWRGGSVTTWAGQCFQGVSRPVLKTIWLLRSQVPVEDNWMATRIGEDTFHRQKQNKLA
uniref:Avidin n=1 Tax=Leptobrachium leishanense TaxID=445787 RepID=A0A8C5QXA8_9ANUR